jgi:5'-methylthioadenosine phosphorylase
MGGDMSKIGIIGGSGLYSIKGLLLKKKQTVKTPFGKPSDQYVIGKSGSNDIIFLPRHGSHHNIPPHMINYRANIWGFRKLGVESIISISAVGGIRKGLKPGDIVILDQITDMTKSRPSTFHDGKDGVIHIDFTEPYCPQNRKILIKAGKRARISLKNGGTYVAVEGPRLETASEIRGFAVLGGDVVGMTGMPEAALARELEICYSGISVVANYAAGINRKKLTTKEVMETIGASTEKLKRLLKETFDLFHGNGGCSCQEALSEAKI